MSKPILLAVDDDTDVLNAVARDLRAKYGRDFRVSCSFRINECPG